MSGRSHDRQRATSVTATGQLHGRLRAVSRVRCHAGWTTTLALGVLQPDRSYTLYGWTYDNSSSTGSVTFNEAQLQGMTPGQVLYGSGYDEKSEQDIYTTGSVAEFRASACTP